MEEARGSRRAPRRLWLVDPFVDRPSFHGLGFSPTHPLHAGARLHNGSPFGPSPWKVAVQICWHVPSIVQSNSFPPQSLASSAVHDVTLQAITGLSFGLFTYPCLTE